MELTEGEGACRRPASKKSTPKRNSKTFTLLQLGLLRPQSESFGWARRVNNHRISYRIWGPWSLLQARHHLVLGQRLEIRRFEIQTASR